MTFLRLLEMAVDESLESGGLVGNENGVNDELALLRADGESEWLEEGNAVSFSVSRDRGTTNRSWNILLVGQRLLLRRCRRQVDIN